jgi:hypothetical protein
MHFPFYRTKPKLSPTEGDGLSKAIEMSVYSKVYISLSKKLPPIKEGTRSAATMKSIILQYLDEAGKIAPLHYIKLTRNVGKLVKTTLTKSLQDFFR